MPRAAGPPRPPPRPGGLSEGGGGVGSIPELSPGAAPIRRTCSPTAVPVPLVPLRRALGSPVVPVPRPVPVLRGQPGRGSSRSDGDTALHGARGRFHH